MSEILLYLGLGIFILGGIGLLIAAFRTHILWGFAVLLVAPVGIVYLLLHWQDAKGAFKTQVLGLVLIVISVYLSGDVSIPSKIDANFFSSIRASSEPVISWTPINGGSTFSVISSESSSTQGSASQPSITRPSATQQFRCDGRQHCSQMRSRAEAEFFIRNCPNTKMDGDNDGTPCEGDSRF